MISEKLLSEAISIEVDEIIKTEGNFIYFCIGLPLSQKINIYELAHKCKEWAFKQGYPFNILYRHNYWDRCEPKYDIDLYNHRKSFCDDIECIAIFKACEWILQNKEQ